MRCIGVFLCIIIECYSVVNRREIHTRKLHMKKLYLLVLGFIFLGQYDMDARHIIGGNMTYKCLENDRYQFTLKVYRDCGCSNCAYFDDQAAIGVYRCGNTVDCGSLNQVTNDLFTSLNVRLGPVSYVDLPDYPCLIPPDVCVQEGVYTFELFLPAGAESYHVSYQRCCRNETISNIINPDAMGATYSVEITPEAQQMCNSSPVFNSFPPTVLCAGQPFEYDHSATDADGDQLVYEFCAPFLGGGNNLSATFVNTCIGAAPIPACPPPYSTVDFTPGYTPFEPMAGLPPVTIDPLTGVISGTPDQIGQFVVGVCVSEYRDGVLLSQIFRDFQFNVANCDPTVIADIREDAQLADQEFIVNSCGNTVIQFDNQSYQEQYIDEYFWRFDINGSPEVFNEWSPTVEFPGVGTYNGVLILNPGTECGDTATIYVNVYPAIEADFSFDYDTCVAGPVTFTDLSSTGSCCLTGWDWSFGDGNSSLIQHPEHIYRVPGDIPVTLTVRDTNQCEDRLTKVLAYYPVPDLIVISPSTFLGCQPADIFFNNLSFPIDTTYDILWEFGDGGTGGEISPWHTYEEPGTYTVSVSITSPIGCETDTTFNDLIKVRPSPVSIFDFDPERVSILEPNVQFEDQSEDAYGGVYWNFGDGGFSSQLNPYYTYSDTGVVQVTHIATHLSGCQDTSYALIDVFPEVRYFLPNGFTPNGDGLNDEYKGVGIMKGATNFNMTIWNRWGEMVFEASDPEDGWDGNKRSTGKAVPAGVYVVLVSYNDPRGKPVKIKGLATVVK